LAVGSAPVADTAQAVIGDAAKARVSLHRGFVAHCLQPQWRGVAILLVLQAAQALATVLLPHLSADAIDLGVVMAVRQDAHLSLLLAVRMPLMLLTVALLMSRTVPYFPKMQGQIDRLRLARQNPKQGKRIFPYVLRGCLPLLVCEPIAAWQAKRRESPASPASP
jgi:hypothetical protein